MSSDECFVFFLCSTAMTVFFFPPFFVCNGVKLLEMPLLYFYESKSSIYYRFMWEGFGLFKLDQALFYDVPFSIQNCRVVFI